MEELWKKFKEETQESMQKINDFLNETSSNEKSILNEETKVKNETSATNAEQIILEDEKSLDSSRKNIYGKLKDLVNEIMEKEHISRAQAYRKAKKEFSTVDNRPL